MKISQDELMINDVSQVFLRMKERITWVYCVQFWFCDWLSNASPTIFPFKIVKFFFLSCLWSGRENGGENKTGNFSITGKNFLWLKASF